LPRSYRWQGTSIVQDEQLRISLTLQRQQPSLYTLLSSLAILHTSCARLSLL
jgi:hypothetical protein